MLHWRSRLGSVAEKLTGDLGHRAMPETKDHLEASVGHGTFTHSFTPAPVGCSGGFPLCYFGSQCHLHHRPVAREEDDGCVVAICHIRCCCCRFMKHLATCHIATVHPANLKNPRKSPPLQLLSISSLLFSDKSLYTLIHIYTPLEYLPDIPAMSYNFGYVNTDTFEEELHCDEKGQQPRLAVMVPTHICLDSGNQTLTLHKDENDRWVSFDSHPDPPRADHCKKCLAKVEETLKHHQQLVCTPKYHHLPTSHSGCSCSHHHKNVCTCQTYSYSCTVNTSHSSCVSYSCINWCCPNHHCHK